MDDFGGIVLVAFVIVGQYFLSSFSVLSCIVIRFSCCVVLSDVFRSVSCVLLLRTCGAVFVCVVSCFDVLAIW